MFCGGFHTVCFFGDVVHSFGRNEDGQLGLGHCDNISIPTPISNLSKIKNISCGNQFTVCVDEEGLLWSFGDNSFGQIGLGENITNSNTPKQIKDIPPATNVSCGSTFTLVITKDENLWSFGRNSFGQLCLGNIDEQYVPKQTSFSKIVNISTGYGHSFFQNSNGEIFGCGANDSGQLGLGSFNRAEIQVQLIPNLSTNIIQFSCGEGHSLFLDKEGNVFSVGNNSHGNLGLGHNTNLNSIEQINDIPKIKSISCSSDSCYLLDFDGNVWCFGRNSDGQLGLGDFESRNIPTRIEVFKNIQQISNGFYCSHLLVKDSQNKIFVTGWNNFGQLGKDNSRAKISTPEELNL